MSQHNVALERKEIVARYDRGREVGAVIDPWEDPQFEVYHTTDRYGFIHDKRLPTVAANDSKDKKLKDTEMRRVDKWLKMLQNWDQAVNTEKFRKRVYKGIPNRVRNEVWKKLLNINQIKKEQDGVYKKMRDLACTQSPEIRQIDLDVNRTYRNHRMFRERYGPRQKMLFYVLGAYSMYNTEVGYCQGMSQVAALLLMYMEDDEDAFWGLSVLMSDRKFAMHGFFIPGFPKLIRFQLQHETILKKLLPKVKKHIDKHDIHTNLYSVKWFFQCFLDRVPFHLCLRLWDIYLFEGERLLIAMAYNIFRMHQRNVLKLKSMETVIDLLQRELELDFGFTDDQVIEKLEDSMEELRRQKLDMPSTVDNELPTKPFGLLYNPTIGTVRQGLETSKFSDRTSRMSSDDKSVNGHATKAPPIMMHELAPKAVSEDAISRPTSRQMHASIPSVYDNVDTNNPVGGRGNRVRPVELHRPVSPQSPENSMGDHRYISYIQVSAEGQDKVLRHSSSMQREETEVITTEYITTHVRSPTGHPKFTTSQISTQRESLKATSGPSHHHGGELSHPSSKTNGRDGMPMSNGGPTVIRIGI